jgi:DNA-binding transcriptional LysR family regulator
MELYQLNIFLQVAEEGNLSRASRRLHLTQPAISRQLQSLEESLGTQLLERGARGVRLTQPGELLRGYAGRILGLARECRNSIEETEEGRAGHLRLGASITAATYILPRILKSFRRSHPGIGLTVFTGTSTQARQMVLDGEVDAGVVMESPAHADLIAHGGASYRLAAVMDPGHALANRRGLTPGELGKEALISMHSQTNLRRMVERLFAAEGVTPLICVEVDHVEAMKKMAEAGLGVAIMPDIAMRAEVNSRKLAMVPLRLRNPPALHWSAVHRRDRHLHFGLRAFLKLLHPRQGAMV